MSLRWSLIARLTDHGFVSPSKGDPLDRAKNTERFMQLLTHCSLLLPPSGLIASIASILQSTHRRLSKVLMAAKLGSTLTSRFLSQLRLTWNLIIAPNC